MDIVVRDNKKLRATNKRLREELAIAKEVARERQVEMEEALSRWRVEQTDLEETQAELEQARAELEQVQAKLAQVRAGIRADEHAKAQAQVERIQAQAHAAIKTERAKSAALENGLKQAQRESESYFRLKAAASTNQRMIDTANSFFSD
jgi:peptidoglycan hydrolase CwlO-like protein